jgi:hypothetical protein
MYYVGKVMNDKTIIAYAKENFELNKPAKTLVLSRSDFSKLFSRAEAIAELPEYSAYSIFSFLIYAIIIISYRCSKSKGYFDFFFILFR